MKFDIVIGNPPFQDNINKKKTQHKIWPAFTEKVFSEWLNESGYLGWITPQSWGSPSNKILELLKSKEVLYMNMDTSKYFPDVASTFSHYVIKNSSNNGKTCFVINGNKFRTNFDENVGYVPSDINSKSINIHGKVMFSDREVYDVGYDYVTCHNVIVHRLTKLEEKLLSHVNSLSTKTGPSLQKACDKISELAQKRKSAKITISKEKTSEHVYPVLHTNKQTWFSSIKQDFSDSKKVMWSRSGYTKPFFDNGTLGCTDMGYYILVDSDQEGKDLEKFLNSDLMSYIFKTAKWSGFGNEKVFCSIPVYDYSNGLNNSDIYNFFDISEQEVEYIDSVLNPTRQSSTKSGKKSEIKSEHRVKRFGEVYTPKELISDILGSIPQSEWEDKEKTVLDPACGSGNFLTETMKTMINNGDEPVNALSRIYGIDILEDNVEQARERMLDLSKQFGIADAEAESIVNKNIVCADSLEVDVSTLFC